jgi:hypothetical protein
MFAVASRALEGCFWVDAEQAHRRVQASVRRAGAHRHQPVGGVNECMKLALIETLGFPFHPVI